jgi:hypothetical protein
MAEHCTLVTFVIDTETTRRISTEIETVCVRWLGRTLFDVYSVGIDDGSCVCGSTSNIEIGAIGVRASCCCVGVADVVCT